MTDHNPDDPQKYAAETLMRQYARDYAAHIAKQVIEESRAAEEFIDRQKEDEERLIRALEAQAKLAQYEPLEQQITRWWLSLPECVRSRRFLIDEIAVACRGMYKVRPAQRKVAQALRALGWQHLRDQTVSGKRRNFWIPPEGMKEAGHED